MKAVLIRTGSVPAQHPLPKIVVGEKQVSVSGVLFSGKSGSMRSPTVHFESKDGKKDNSFSQSIRRTRSEADVVHSLCKARVCESGSRSFRIAEEEEDSLLEEEETEGTLILKKKGLNLNDYERMRRVLEEVQFSGGGIGKGKNVGGGGGGGGGEDEDEGNARQTNIGDYYKQLLKANPGNPLILRNYGKYLHEVKGDMVQAEECYTRAILASPGDGEVLSLYGKLIWESTKDGKRADSYYTQAMQAAPDDCYVMGSYANFLWSADEEEEDDEQEINEVSVRPSTTLIQAC